MVVSIFSVIFAFGKINGKIMAKLTYLIGDATQPIIRENEYSVIVHCCNMLGAWGAGFVIPLAKRYPNARSSYFNYIHKGNVKLGDVDEVKVTDNIYVANLMGQKFLGKGPNGEIPCDYNAIEKGFLNIIGSWFNRNEYYSIHMPRIGCGLAGGDWKVIEDIIKRTFIDMANVDVFVYDLKKQENTFYDNRG